MFYYPTNMIYIIRVKPKCGQPLFFQLNHRQISQVEERLPDGVGYQQIKKSFSVQR